MTPISFESLEKLQRVLRPIRFALLVVFIVFVILTAYAGKPTSTQALGHALGYIIVPELFFALPLSFIKKRSIARGEWDDTQELKTRVGMLVVRALAFGIGAYTLGILYF